MQFVQAMKLMVLGLVLVQAKDFSSKMWEVDCVDRQITQDFKFGEYTYTPECVGFTVGKDTTCTWMCEYCEEQLKTTDYFFFDDVCKYDESGGCQGSPEAGEQYVCCIN